MAIRECQNYRMRLQNTFEYLDEIETVNKSLSKDLKKSKAEISELMKTTSPTHSPNAVDEPQLPVINVDRETQKLEEELAILKEELQKKSSRSDEDHVNQLSKLQGQLSAAHAEKEGMARAQKELQKENEDLKERLENMKEAPGTPDDASAGVDVEKTSQLEGQLSSARDEVKDLKKQLEEAKQVASDSKEQARRQFNTLADEKEKHTNALKQAEEQKKHLQDQIKALKAELEGKEGERSAIQELLDQSKADLEESKADIEGLKNANEEKIERALKEKDQALAQLETYGNSVIDNEKKLKAEIEELKAAIAAAEEKAATATTSADVKKPVDADKCGGDGDTPDENTNAVKDVDDSKNNVAANGTGAVPETGLMNRDELLKDTEEANNEEQSDDDMSSPRTRSVMNEIRHEIELDPASVHDIFEFMASHLLQGNLTESAFVQGMIKVEGDKQKNALRQLFRVMTM